MKGLLFLAFLLNLAWGCAEISAIQERSQPFEPPRYLGTNYKSPDHWTATDWTLHMDMQGGG